MFDQKNVKCFVVLPLPSQHKLKDSGNFLTSTSTLTSFFN